jgi:hypothetical protein
MSASWMPGGAIANVSSANATSCALLRLHRHNRDNPSQYRLCQLDTNNVLPPQASTLKMSLHAAPSITSIADI